ncbi:MAG TPA: mechanosensitive ion channel family protein [Gemmatimonadaceae bacterium]|jgi:small-conductance mechanosensitive channel|nr:mechanosensitive ion channel family protein [Gemmatimonadaceae bacterium]
MNSSEALNTIHEMLRGFSAALPRLILAFVIAVFFYFLSSAVKAAVRRSTGGDSSHRTLRLAMGRIVQGAIIIIGTLVAAAAAFPGFTPGNLISALGIGGIAIGFAFKDIFENFLAGILILVTRPFRIGDQIIYDRYEGTVEEIQTRATWLKTYDGRRILIPNSELFKNSVTVNTAFDTRRLEYDFKLAPGADIEKAKSAIVAVMNESKEVLPDPQADVIVISFDQSSVILRARWWSKSRTSDVLLGQDRVLTAARAALAKAGVKLPSASSTIVISGDNSANAAKSMPQPALAKDQ